MKTNLLRLLLLAVSLVFTVAAVAHDQTKTESPSVPATAGRLEAPTAKDAAWLAKARAAYPLKTCVVSEDELGGMGDVTEMIYREPGLPDRLVRFCCESCGDDFNKEPAKYLQRLREPALPAKPSDSKKKP